MKKCNRKFTFAKTPSPEEADEQMNKGLRDLFSLDESSDDSSDESSDDSSDDSSDKSSDESYFENFWNIQTPQPQPILKIIVE